MGLFRDLGRRAARLKREATDAAREQAPYECTDCGHAVFTDREDCPECGADAVVTRARDRDDDRDATDERDPPDDGDGADTDSET